MGYRNFCSRITGMPVVIFRKYLRRFELQLTRVLWKSLWNCWRRKKFLRVKICHPAQAGKFPASKALNSNQLANSLGINIVTSGGKPHNSRIGVLHISQFLTFRFAFASAHKNRLNCYPHPPSTQPGKLPGEYRRDRSASFVFCLPSVSPGACVCAKCRRRSTSQ